MKRLNIWLCSMLLLCTTACEKDLRVFDDPECLLNFNYGSQLSTEEVTEMMRNGSHSFKLKTPEGQSSDTVWLDVDIMGKLSAENRPLALQQVMVEGTKNAIAGTHYIAFDDPALAKFYVVPAHSATAHIPVILKRDPSLAEGNVVLRITFKENVNFKAGYPEFSTYTLTISDRLAKPNAWDLAYLDGYFGKYGEKKHELMIKWTEESWDDEYINSLFADIYGIGVLYPKDSNYIDWLAKWFAEQLVQENAVRRQNGLDVWKESDTGDPVDFTPEEW